AGSIGLDSFLNAPPLALMYLTPTVPDHKKYLIDLKSKPMPTDKVRRIMKKADLVAISSFTPSIKNAIYLASLAKELEKPVVIGGYHPSLIPEVVMEKSPNGKQLFDVAVRQEGELTFPELVGILDKEGKFTHDNLKNVEGIAYMKENEMIVTDPRPLIKDLDTLPMPDRTLIGNTKYTYFGSTIDSLESSRGCVGNCHFCCVTAHCGRYWRKKSPKRVIKELLECRRNVRWITYQDSEFTINTNRVREICNLVIEYGLDKQWYSAQARADDIVRDVKTLDVMRDSGFRMLFIGIETAHQKSLDRIGKRVSVDVIKKSIKLCHDRGITVYGAVIIGNIGESYNDVLKTIDYAIDLDLDIAQFTALTPYPGTALWDEAIEKGWIEDADWTHYDFQRPVMRTPDLSRLEIAKLVHKAYTKFYGLEKGTIPGKYFWDRAPRFFFGSGGRFRWFFKMLPDFLKNIDKITSLINDLGKPVPIEKLTSKV
ncbi:MAG: B12-binding domain-containing radical SAM protein, partial [Promethearchaeota archaeon]